MAQKFSSPGVFSEEVDQSFLAQGVAGIGAAIIGRSSKGPALTPILVTGYDSFAERFGAVTPSLQAPYAAKNYLKNSGALTFVRVLGHADGTGKSNGYTLGGVTAIADQSGSVDASALAVLHHSGTAAVVNVLGVANDANKFTITIGSVFAATASFVKTAPEYIGKVLNTDPTKYNTYGHYLAQLFEYITPLASASWNARTATGTPTSFAKDYTSGSTAWVKSQPVGGLEFSLFKFHTHGHGQATRDEVKVEISNVKPSPSPTSNPFGTFDVIVRKFDDTDQKPSAVEQFIGCTLDPSSLSFIGRKIGDTVETFDTVQRKFVAEGTYPSKSKYIRVELNTSDNAPEEALPWGHRGYAKLAFTTSTVDDLPYAQHQVDRNGNIDPNIRWGVVFASGGIADRMWADPLSPTNATDTEFSLALLSASWNAQGKQVWSYNSGLSSALRHQPVYASASLYKFSLPMAGGFDGWDVRVTDPLYLGNAVDENSSAGLAAGTGGGHAVISAKRAIDAIANPDAFDMNLLVFPGVHNLKIVDYARQLVNDRKDVMLVMDVTGSSVAEAIDALKTRDLDDNYTACYYPDLKINDRVNNRTVRVAPSVAVIGALAYSDRVGQVFFAPAGMNRGGLAAFDVVDTVDRLDFEDRNDLYENRINPIATFPSEGIVVWGQKTLQVKASALDRVNIRRLMIYAKKTVASAAKVLVFEPNQAATWQRFINTVNPILEKIRQDQGVERFKVVMDSTTNTPDVVDRNIMRGKIFLQPTKTAEFIDLSFVITNAGVSFGE